MIQKIQLVKFRSHSEYFLDAESKKLVFVGANGSGKTSLLEAIYLALTGESFRGNDVDMINLSANESGVTLRLGRQVRQVKLSREPAAKVMLINQRKTIRRSDYRKNIGVVLFEPDELRMLTGPAELRRRWLDQTIGSISDKYPNVLSNYNRALKQRNRLLKTGVISEDQYFVWEIKLSEYGAHIISARQKLIEKLNLEIGDHYSLISGKHENIKVSYSMPSGNDHGGWLARSLRVKRSHDQKLGYTTVGPHRDDFSIDRDSKSISETGSRGEVRSLVLAMKMIEAGLVENHTGSKPIILLDDVLSELDLGRRSNLLELFRDHQTFVTATDLDEQIVAKFNFQVIKL